MSCGACITCGICSGCGLCLICGISIPLFLGVGGAALTGAVAGITLTALG